MSDTPRTDAAVSFVHCLYSVEKYPNDIPVVSKGFAQALEREADNYKYRLTEQQERQALNLSHLEQEVRDSISLRAGMSKEIDALKLRCKELEQEIRDSVRTAQQEAAWKHAQGDEYGSY